MSTFNNNGVTLKGAVIIASLVAGDTLTFTRIAVGDGVLPAGQSIFTTEKLVNHLFDVPILSVESDSVAHATVRGAFNNGDLNTGFYYREIGLFAINPVTNAEELFCYGNAGDLAEWISPAGQSSLIEKEIHLVTLIGNATNVAATFNPVASVLRLKADLDDTPENGGRVLASQMRFDAEQTLYVDAAASVSGDGTQEKPFKTIMEAVIARYMGAAVIYIKIKPGTYAEKINVPRSPGTTWRFEREGTGTVSIQGMIADNAAYVVLDYLTFNAPANSTEDCVQLLNCAHTSFSNVTVNGNTNLTGVSVNAGRARFFNTNVNNCGAAIAATNGSVLALKTTGGTGNVKGLHADSSIIVSDFYIPGASTPYEAIKGGAISVQDGHSSFPSNFAKLYPLGEFETADALRNAIMQEFNKLGVGESRYCWFANNISEGFGPFDADQRMQVEIIKSTNYGNGYGTVFFKSHHNQPLAHMQIIDGYWAQPEPIAFAEDLPATPATYGLVRVAAVEDEQNCQCEDAAITPANLYDLNNYRKASTAYKVGDVVACPYHAELMLKCTQAGTTSTGSLDTTSATLGKVYTDGGVKWEVINPLDNYLPKVGGAITGSIIADTAIVIKGRANSTHNVIICSGADYNTDPAIALFPLTTTAGTPGAFNIYAGAETKVLHGEPSGLLTWDGKEIVTITTSGTSEDKHSYLKFADGTLICYGECRVEANGQGTLTFAHPFVKKPRITLKPAMNNEQTKATYFLATSNPSTTSFTVLSSISGFVGLGDYIAIGRWK